VEDVYLTLVAGPREGDDRVVVGVRVNPLVAWLWIGAGVMVVGTAVAAWPSRRRRRRRRRTMPTTEAVPAGDVAVRTPVEVGS
jgi:cytochrome c biogenesis factor